MPAQLRGNPPAILGSLVAFIVVLSKIAGVEEGVCWDNSAPAPSSHEDLVEIRIVDQILGVVGTVVPYLHIEYAEGISPIRDQLVSIIRARWLSDKVSPMDGDLFVVESEGS